MKKIITVFISAIICLSVCACGNNLKGEQKTKKEPNETKEITELYWGMTFTETRSYVEKELNFPFANSAHWYSGKKFREFEANNFNDIGDGQLYVHHGDENSLDAVRINIDDATPEKTDEFLRFLTNELGEYSDFKSTPYETTSSGAYQEQSECYIWETENFYGELNIVTYKKDTGESIILYFLVTPDSETFETLNSL